MNSSLCQGHGMRQFTKHYVRNVPRFTFIVPLPARSQIEIKWFSYSLPLHLQCTKCHQPIIFNVPFVHRMNGAQFNGTIPSQNMRPNSLHLMFSSFEASLSPTDVSISLRLPIRMISSANTYARLALEQPSFASLAICARIYFIFRIHFHPGRLRRIDDLFRD